MWVAGGLARAVDVLIVAAAGGSSTQGLVSREVIDASAAMAAPRQPRSHRRSVRTAGRIREEDADRGEYFVFPTVVTDVAPDSALASEEQFGPVLPIFGYDDIEDAVAAANATEFGLTASVWTGDDALANTVTGQLVAGTVSVNCHGMAAQDPRCRSAA